jgi:hypothetical protein
MMPVMQSSIDPNRRTVPKPFGVAPFNPFAFPQV